jgi:eukaryotic-like serine/threonine-protein kinase
MAATGYWLFQGTVQEATHEVITHALDTDRLAARSVADRFGLEIDKRFRILEREAKNPELRRWLAQDRNNADVANAIDQWLHKQQTAWDPQFPEGTRPSLWFVVDRAGYQRGTWPANEALLNKYFGWRDYFHGLGKNLPETQPVPAPIRQPHRSMVYKRRGEDQSWAVSFSVPVFASDEREPSGVLGMTSDLDIFTHFRGLRSQFAVLIDVRPDETGQRGLIVEHPALTERYSEKRRFEPAYYSEQVVEFADAVEHVFPGTYRDPLDEDASARWLAAMERVVLPRPEVEDTGWVVLVQANYEETVRPLEALRHRLHAALVTAVTLVGIILVGLWGYVVVVLNEVHGGRVGSLLRQKLGLRTSATGAGPGSTAASARSVGTSVQTAPRSEPPAKT